MSRHDDAHARPARSEAADPAHTGPLLVLLALVGLAAAVVAITTPGRTPSVIAVAAAVALVVVAAWRLGAMAGRPRPAPAGQVEDPQSRPDLIAAVSHDLRTPLPTIGAYVELLEAGDAGELSGDQKQMLDVVEENVRRAYAIADDLVELRGADSGRREPVDIGEVVASAVRAIEPSARQRDLTLQLDSDLSGARVDGSAVQLERVIANLLSNAVKFTPAGGIVAVQAHIVRGNVVIGVTDTGAGIPSAEQQRIFERFYRADDARAKRVPGSGLGLAIVRELTAGHGGTVDVRSKPGQGATFTLTLPALAAVAGR